MSSGDRLLMILHIGFAIFALGPLTAATMATPRYIRRADATVMRYLNRATRIYGLLTLGIFLFGLLLAHGDFSRVWLSASMTLFIVALVLLLIVERDQRKALHKIELAAAERHGTPAETARTPEAPADAPRTTETAAADKPVAGTEAKVDTGTAAPTPGPAPAAAPGPARTADRELAKVETGRIATLSGVVALIWIVILVLMVWNGAG
jgi:Ca2+/Na+ antiporter